MGRRGRSRENPGGCDGDLKCTTTARVRACVCGGMCGMVVLETMVMRAWVTVASRMGVRGACVGEGFVQTRAGEETRGRV
jgi:hypothetical protein